MLGNFSFGDYFKHEATAWAWEYITKVLELPIDKLWVTIYQDDDEAFDIWTKEVGVDPARIVRLGKEDNFWEHGSGPCGPCSEIYFDRGEEHGCGSPTCGRLACVMQGVDNLFEVDTVQNIMKKISEIAGVTYGQNERSDVSLRVITDHIRSTTFMIGDGVSPSNSGRGYVLRRLLRRAARHGRLLGITEPFLYQVVDTVAHENLSAYPELTEKADYIKKVVKNEEEAFHRTIGKGMDLLMDLIDITSEYGSDPDAAWALTGYSEIQKMHDFRHAAAETVIQFIEKKHALDKRIIKLGIKPASRGRTFSEIVSGIMQELSAANLHASVYAHIKHSDIQVNFLPEDYEEYQKSKAIANNWI